MSTGLIGSNRDRTVHQELIREISRESGVPEGKVTQLYESELARLRAGAKIVEYLPVLIRRRIMDTIRSEGLAVHRV